MHEPSTSKPSNDPTRPPSRLRRNSVSAQPPPTSSHAPLEKKPQTFFGMNVSMRGSTTSLATAKEAPVAIQRRQRTQSLTKKNSPATMSRPNLSWPMTAAQKEEPQSPREPLRRRIMFYEWTRPYYCFTNFSPHLVTYKGKTYPTSEHLFQSFKFQDHRPGLAEHIRLCCPGPNDALLEARRFQPEVRPDWMKVNIQKMEETLRLKFDQHLTLREELLKTGNAELFEDSDKDDFWGGGADRRGRNELGKALERLRDQLCRDKRAPPGWKRW